MDKPAGFPLDETTSGLVFPYAKAKPGVDPFDAF